MSAQPRDFCLWTNVLRLISNARRKVRILNWRSRALIEAAGTGGPAQTTLIVPAGTYDHNFDNNTDITLQAGVTVNSPGGNAVNAANTTIIISR